MKDKLSIPKFVSFASGRIMRIAKDANRKGRDRNKLQTQLQKEWSLK